MKESPRSLASKIYQMRADIARLQAGQGTPQLASSSIEDGSVDEYDADGRLVSRIGRQPDGSHGSRVVESPAQPVPSAPVLRAGDAGVVMVRWDGGADGPVPLVHGHVEVVASGPSSPAEVVSTIRDRDGGATSFVADEAGTWSVHLVMVGQDRKTRSEASAVSTIEVVMPVDGEQINDRLDAGEERLSDAKAEWEQSKQDLQDGLDTINDETFPSLRSDMDRHVDALIDRGNNLVVNGGFEVDDPDSSLNLYGWEPNNGHVTRASSSRTGSYSIRLGAPAIDDSPAAAFASRIPTQAGRKYRASVWAWKLTHGDDSESNFLQFVIRFHHNDGSTSHNFGPTTDRSFGVGGFQQWTNDFTIPDDNTIVGIQPMWRAQPGSGAYLVDDIDAYDITEASEALAEAEAARASADQKTTILLSTSAPTSSDSASEGTRWEQYQDFTSWKLIGSWVMQDGSWQATGLDPVYIPQLDASIIATGKLSAVRIDVASLYADTGFIGSFHAETVEAMRVTAESAFIGGSLLEDDSITTPKLTAESVTSAKIAALAVKAAQIDANDIVANSAFVAELEAHGITLSAEANERTFEISGEGWQLTDTSTGQVLASLGVNGDLLLRSIDTSGRMSEMSGAGFRTEAADGTPIFDSRGGTGTDSTAFGVGATSSGEASTALGRNAEASGWHATALGNAALADVQFSTAVGEVARASSDGATAVGNDSTAEGLGSAAFGAVTTATGTSSLAVGTEAESTGDSSTAVGRRTSAGGDVSTALGMEANATNVGATALGYQSEALNNYGTAVGYQSSASGDVSTSLGPGSSASGYASVAIGRAAEVTSDNTGVLGGTGSTRTNHWVVPGDFDVQGTAGGDGLIREISSPVIDSYGNSVSDARAYILMGRLAVVNLYLSSVEIPQTGGQDTPIVRLHSDLGSASNREQWSAWVGAGIGMATGLVRSDGDVTVRWSNGSDSSTLLVTTLTYIVA